MTDSLPDHSVDAIVASDTDRGFAHTVAALPEGPFAVVVLLPTATLEDFPTSLLTADARGLLASVTVAYDPRLIAASGSSPTFCRGDSPTPPHQKTLYLVSPVAKAKLPENFEHRIDDAGGRIIYGSDRDEFLAALGLPTSIEQATERALPTPPSIGAADFYAVGYVWLQIQIMTRRLRYTSNLDEIHLQTILVEAAVSFTSGDFGSAAETLHQVFDALGEERDHYFTSDPHLIDLTLVTRTTLPTLVKLWNSSADQSTSSHSTASLLIDSDCFHEDGQTETSLTETSLTELRRRIDAGEVSVAGGGPPATDSLGCATMGQSIELIEHARQQWIDRLGTAPSVYARLAGQTPGDLVPAIAAMGYTAIIPIDFTSGRPIGDEAKVRLSTADKQDIDALVATPIDAADDSSFLNLGPRLGSAIDDGEMATALLVHWPGGGCDSMSDLVRASRWSHALGRFWSIADYFSEGESPFHHGVLDIVASDESLDEAADSGDDLLGKRAEQFSDQVRSEYCSIARAIVSLANDAVGGDEDARGVKNAGGVFETISSPQSSSVGPLVAAAVGAIPSDQNDARLIFHPGPTGRRVTTTLSPANGKAPSKSESIYGATRSAAAPANQSVEQKTGGRAGYQSTAFDVTADVPSGGFVVIRGGDGSGTKSGSLLGRMLGKSGSPIVRTSDARTLENEFMEVSLSSGGGLAGLYSGAARGNRLSLRLVAAVAGGTDTIMHPSKWESIENSAARGVVKESGHLLDPDNSNGEAGDYEIQYTIERGSRMLNVCGQIRLASGFQLDPSDPWRNYIAVRIAMPDESASIRYGVRDKWHRCSSRRITAPYGYLIDDVDRQTLLATGGHSYHRRVGGRFVDTLIAVGKNRRGNFDFGIACDSPHPMATAIDSIAPPIELSVLPHRSLPTSGYLCHLWGANVRIRQIKIDRTDSELTWHIDLLATRGQSTNARLRFCRDIKFAKFSGGDVIEHQKDTVKLSLVGHQQLSIVIVFE